MIGKMLGADQMIAKLKSLAAQFPDRVAASLYKRAQIIMTEAKRRCPVAPDGGVLRASGRVAMPVRVGKLIYVVLSFGGGAISYAIAVHEHLSEHSPRSWRIAEERGAGVHWTSAGTGPKFLEGPINEALPTLAAGIAADIHFDAGGWA